MKKIATLVVIVLLALSIFWALSRKGKRTGVVYYYPRTNTYFDSSAQTYIYRTPGQDQWQETETLADSQRAVMGQRVRLDSVPDPVWKYNDRDRLLYSVRLYTAEEELNKKFIEDSLSSLPKPVDTTGPTMHEGKPPEEKDSKSRFRRFIDKLFGKKDP